MPLTDDKEKNKLASSYATSATQIPTILLPGIFGHEMDFAYLSSYLSTHYYWPLLKYKDAIHEDYDFEPFSSLEEQAQSISSEILSRIAYGPAPIQIIAYSFGCALAPLVAQNLREKNRDTILFLIDGPTPSCSSDFIKTPSVALVENLIKICVTAAKMAIGMDAENFLNFSQDDIENLLQNIPHEEFALQCLDILQEQISKQITDESYLEIFSLYLNVARQNLTNLYNYQAIPLTFDKTYLLVTDETRKTYQSTQMHYTNDTYGENLGWDKESPRNQLTIVENKFLQQTSHLGLLNKFNARLLSKCMTDYLANETSEEKLCNYHIQFLCKAYKHKFKITVEKNKSKPANNEANPSHLYREKAVKDTKLKDIKTQSESMLDVLHKITDKNEAVCSMKFFERSKKNKVDLFLKRIDNNM